MFPRIPAGWGASVSGSGIIVLQQNILGEGVHAASIPLSGEFAESVSSLYMLAPSRPRLSVLQPSASDTVAGGEGAGRWGASRNSDCGSD